MTPLPLSSIYNSKFKGHFTLPDSQSIDLVTKMLMLMGVGSILDKNRSPVQTSSNGVLLTFLTCRYVSVRIATHTNITGHLT
jgi:hypothetical protein